MTTHHVSYSRDESGQARIFIDGVDRTDDFARARLRRLAARVRGDLVRFGYPRHTIERLTIEELLELRERAIAHLMDAPISAKEDSI